MAKNPKQSSAEMASTASRIMLMAKQGGPFEASREALRHSLRNCDRAEVQDNSAEVHFADSIIDAISRVLKPYIDDAESLAASVVSQAKGK